MLSDSASNCVKAKRIVQEQYPHITVGPCAAHVWDLCLEDIAKHPHVVENEAKVRQVVRFVRDHGKLLAEYHRKAKDLHLKLPKNTRFKSVYIMMGRALEAKTLVQQAMFSQAFNELAESPISRNAAARVKRLALDDELWEHVEGITTVGQPICVLLDYSNGDVRLPLPLAKLVSVLFLSCDCTQLMPFQQSMLYEPHLLEMQLNLNVL